MANLSVTFYSLLVVGLVSELAFKTVITYLLTSNRSERYGGSSATNIASLKNRLMQPVNLSADSYKPVKCRVTKNSFFTLKLYSND